MVRKLHKSLFALKVGGLVRKCSRRQRIVMLTGHTLFVSAAELLQTDTIRYWKGAALSLVGACDAVVLLCPARPSGLASGGRRP